MENCLARVKDRIWGEAYFIKNVQHADIQHIKLHCKLTHSPKSVKAVILTAVSKRYFRVIMFLAGIIGGIVSDTTLTEAMLVSEMFIFNPSFTPLEYEIYSMASYSIPL